MSNHWLADFCDSMRIFTVIVVTQVMVIIYSLSFLSLDYTFLNHLATINLLAQLIAITLVILLCKLKKFFNQFQVYIGVILLSVLIVLVTTLYTQLIIKFDNQLGFGLVADVSLVNLKLTTATLMTVLGLVRYFYIRQQWSLQIEAHAKSQLNALQARIKPHFLYNSMNSIASLIAIDAVAAEKAVLNLSGLFRKAFADHAKLVSLEQEIEWVDQYLAIEQLRLQDRLIYTSTIDGELLSHKIPVLCIQPLIENAVLHGIQHLPHGGEITLRIEKDKQTMSIMVTNPYNKSQKSQGSGMGLENIRKRLKLTYDQRASLQTQADKQTFTATLLLPL